MGERCLSCPSALTLSLARSRGDSSRTPTVFCARRTTMASRRDRFDFRNSKKEPGRLTARSTRRPASPSEMSRMTQLWIGRPSSKRIFAHSLTPRRGEFRLSTIVSRLGYWLARLGKVNPIQFFQRWSFVSVILALVASVNVPRKRPGAPPPGLHFFRTSIVRSR